jgi:hypothetical protein
MAIKLQIRRDTLNNWTANQTVVLLEGEIGYVTNTRNMKIGDGTTQWQNLKYQAPFYTGTNSTLATTTLSVDQTNNYVGIGTSSPLGPLHVNRSSVGTNITFGVSSVIGEIGQDAGNNNLFNAWNGHVFQCGSTERMRIVSDGKVGIATTSPAGTIGVVGDAVIGNQASTGTSGTMRLVSSAGVNYIQSALAATASSAAPLVISPFGGGAEWMRVTSSGVSVTGTTSSSGALTVASGGLTVTAGGATVTAGGLTVTAGSVSLPSNSVSLGTVAQIAAGNFLGNSSGSTANVAAVTQAQARTMLGLIPAAYTSPVISNTAWTNTALSGSTAINLDLDVTTLGIGVISRIPISLGRSGGSGNASVLCRAIVEAGETLLILGGFDINSAASFTGLSTGTGVCWFWLNTAWTSSSTPVADAQQTRFLPMYAYSGANTVSVLRWGQITSTSVQVNAEVIVIRLS